MKHRHAELMKIYAEDAMETEKPWERWQIMCISINTRVADIWTATFHDPFDKKPFKCRTDNNIEWRDLIEPPTWNPVNEYRRKPRTVNINGFDVPEPVRSPLENGTIYYISYISAPDDALAWECKWRSDKYDFNYLKKGIVHLVEEAAIKHAEALLSFTRIEK